jgi:hypothetical protein
LRSGIPIPRLKGSVDLLEESRFRKIGQAFKWRFCSPAAEDGMGEEDR